MTIQWSDTGRCPPGGAVLELREAGQPPQLRRGLCPDLYRAIVTAWMMYATPAVIAAWVTDHEGHCYCCLPPFAEVDERTTLVATTDTYPAPDARQIGRE